MKHFLFIIVLMSFYSCVYLGENSTSIVTDYVYYDAVTIERAELNNSIELIEDQTVYESSKIYIVDNYIFVNDHLKGFHIFDNTNPENPIKKYFLKFPGATDIAIRNNTLYVNQATDLVTLSFNFENVSFTIEDRIENVFPELIPPEDSYYNDIDNEDAVIVDWIQK